MISSWSSVIFICLVVMSDSEPSSPSQLSPRTSPRSDSPPTSQLKSDPPTSPLTVDSSPVRAHSSPLHAYSSFCDDSPPIKRRKPYEFSELMTPQDPSFWPQDEIINDDSRESETGTRNDEAEPMDEITDISEADDEGSGVGFTNMDSDMFTEFHDPAEQLHSSSSGENREESPRSVSVIAASVTEDPRDEVYFRQEADCIVLSDLSDASSDSDTTESEPLIHYFNSRLEEEENETASQSSSSHGSEVDVDEEIQRESDSDSDSSISNAKIYAGSNLTISEGVLTLMELFLDNKLTKTTMGQITAALQKFIPSANYMPKTKHQLFKFITDRSPPVPVTTHYYCSECLFYLGKIEKNCTLCNSSSKKFYQLCLESQIRNLFEHHNLADLIEKYDEERRSRLSQAGYSDFCDGKEYKRAHYPGKYNLTLLGHTDGIQISESSDVSLWPLEWVILEISHHCRFKYLIVSGIWVGDSHPYMNCFLRPFVDELKELYVKGIKWIHPKTKNAETTFVVAPVFCADGPVRADIQNILYHGGRYCCHVCEQKMAKLDAEPIPPGLDKPPPRRRAFQLLETASKLRTAPRMDAQGQLTLRLLQTNRKANPVKGVKGNSVVSELPKCDRSTVVYPEYMHLLIGIIKQFMELWFEGDINSAMSLKQYRDAINQFLRDVRVPDFVSRTPRSVDCYSSWKANELRTFLLYLSLIIFSECMSAEYLQHWMLFVSAMYLLLQDTISESDVTRAEIMIRMFLRDFSKLYVKKKFTYNLHQLSHLAHITRLWGPSYLNSAFWFESFNGTLSKCIHGTKEQGQELINTIQLIQGVQILKARSHPQDSGNSKSVFTLKNLVEEYTFDSSQKQLLKSSGFVKPIYKYYRASRNSEDFTSKIYVRQEKRNNYTIFFKDQAGNKKYGEIQLFVANGNHGGNENRKMALVNLLDIEHTRLFIHRESQYVVPHIIPVKESDDVVLIPVENILFKVIRVGNYVCLRPNKIESNL